MSYALSRPSNTARSGLLGVVIGLHVGMLLLILAAKTVAPKIMELPLIVDFIQPPQIEQPVEPKPLPTRQQVVKQQRAAPPKAPAPLIETTQSTVSEPTAPVVSQAEARPTAAVPPAEPVTQPRFDADYLKNPAPPYPPLSRRMGEEGKVILRVVVTPQGSAESVDVKTSSCSTRLDEAAQKSVRNWRFIPAKRGDTAIQSAVLVPIIFKLEK